jgi:uncharacterized beta-barrel protein YwiB (DUF1934 family)
MKQPVVLSIRGQQTYLGQDPEVIELVTEGTMEYRDGGWDLCYEESALTGLEGVTTTFRVLPDQVTLTRTGKLHSEMVFRVGEVHDSLYRIEFGALMLSVMASRVETNITEEDGGVIDLTYAIEIEQTAAGVIDYHLDIKPKK